MHVPIVAALNLSESIGLQGVRNFVLCKKQRRPQMTEARSEMISRKRSGSWVKAWFNKSLSSKMLSHWYSCFQLHELQKSLQWTVVVCWHFIMPCVCLCFMIAFLLGCVVVYTRMIMCVLFPIADFVNHHKIFANRIWLGQSLEVRSFINLAVLQHTHLNNFMRIITDQICILF